jgi:hypothetical protein
MSTFCWIRGTGHCCGLFAGMIGLLMATPLGADVWENPSMLTLKVGQSFPPVTLPSLADGRPMSIAQFRGQKVLLHLFASW